MRTVKQVSVKNRQNYYFFDDMTNIGDFDPSLLNADSIEFKSNKSIIYEIKYIKNLNSSDSLYFVFNTFFCFYVLLSLFCFQTHTLKKVVIINT